MTAEYIWNILDTIKKEKPLVHCITNTVTVNDCANILLAAGASPTMAHHPLEVEEVTAACRSLVLNMGATECLAEMLSAGRKAAELGYPVILDPVGVSGSTFRRNSCLELIRTVHPRCIRGNLSEIRALLQQQNTGAGVDESRSDAAAEAEKAKQIVRELADRYGCLVIASGKTDLISDGNSVLAVLNGSEQMAHITGTGCMSSALEGAFLAAENSLFSAAACCAFMGICGETAAMKTMEKQGGTGTFHMELLDAVSTMKKTDAAGASENPLIYRNNRIGYNTGNKSERGKQMNINEIAKMAGVSRTAVSRYINNGYVSAEKKERIREVIEKTGYRPSSHAQMLRTRKTRMIGVILPKINSQSISSMTAGISSIADKNGYQILLANTQNSIEEEIRYLRVFREKNVDGIIFIATVLTDTHKKVLAECGIPVVILGQRLQGYSSVYQDDFNAAKEITAELLKKCTCPGFIGVLEGDMAVGFNRRKGFEAALTEKKYMIDESAMIKADFSIDSGYEKMKELYEKNPALDGVMCVTESIAIGAMVYLKEIGRKIPQEMRIAAMGDSPICKALDPKLTTVHFHYETSGMEAAKLLIEEITDPQNVKKELCMSYELKISESTK